MARRGKSKLSKKTAKKKTTPKPAKAALPKPSATPIAKKITKKPSKKTPAARVVAAKTARRLPVEASKNNQPKTRKRAMVIAPDELLATPVRVMPAEDPQPELILKPNGRRARQGESPSNRNAPPPMSFYRPAATGARAPSGPPSFSQSPPPPAPAPAPIVEPMSAAQSISFSQTKSPSDPEPT